MPWLRLHDLRHTFGTLAVQAFPLTDVKAYMGHADISTMIYVHHVPRIDAADRLSKLVAAAESVPRLKPVTGHIREHGCREVRRGRRANRHGY